MLGHPDNYILANPLSTPPHIVPEWYFLPFYAILRSIPNKAFGVILMFLSIFTLYLLPYINAVSTASSAFRPIFRVIFWLFFCNCLILGWIGGNPVEHPFYLIGQVATFFYFLFFYIVVPYLSKLELNLNEIISD